MKKQETEQIILQILNNTNKLYTARDLIKEIKTPEGYIFHTLKKLREKGKIHHQKIENKTYYWKK